MSLNHVDELVHLLVDAMAAHPKGRPAHRLWQGARKVFGNKSVGRARGVIGINELIRFEVVETILGRISKKYPASVKCGGHIRVLLDVLRIEGEKHAQIMMMPPSERPHYIPGHPRYNPTYRNAVLEFDLLAELDGLHPEEVALACNTASDALESIRREYRIEIKPFRQKLSIAPIGWCNECWRIGSSRGKRLYLCKEHLPLTSVYKKSHLAKNWQPGYWHPNEHRSYEWVQMDALTAQIPRRFWDIPRDWSEQIFRGSKAQDLPIENFKIDLEKYQSLFKKVNVLLQRKKGRRVSLDRIAEVMKLLDPLGKSHRDERAEIHKLMEIDQRNYVIRLMRAEAHLATGRRRSGNWGGRRRKGVRGKARDGIYAY